MLDKIVTIYQKMEMELVGGLSGATANVIDETNFYDVGYMQAKIKTVQKKLKDIATDIEMSIEANNNSNSEREYRAELIKEREQLLGHMVFLASNSFKNLDDCLRMADGHKFPFLICVRALKEYDFGNKEKAFDMLEVYYSKYQRVEEHYLVNKVFGLLLIEKGNYKKASTLLTYALKFVPDDIECLNGLKRCYWELNERRKEAVITEILGVLG